MSITTPQRVDFVLDLRSGLARRRAVGISILTVLSFCMLVVLVQRFDAPIVLAASVLLLGAVPLLLRPELATLLTVFLLYINFPAVLTKQHGIPSVLAGSFILLLVVPLVYFLVIRRESLKVDTTFHLMLLLLASFLISSFAAIDKSIALARTQEFILEGILVYLLLINAIRNLQTLRRVIWTILVAGGLLGSLSLYQAVSGSYEQEFGGLAYRNYEVVQDNADREGPGKRQGSDRAQGPVNEPNRYGQIMIVLLPLAMYMYRTARPRVLRLWATGLGVLILAGVVLTLSRGAFTGLVLLAGAMIILRWIRPSRMLVCVILFAATVSAVPFFVERVNSISNASNLVGGDPSTRSREADGAVRDRTTVMLSALHAFLDYPILGVGPGQFPPFYVQEYSRSPEIKSRDIRTPRRAHNLYLEMAAETGVVGLGIFLAAVGVLLRNLLRARREWLRTHPEFSDLAIGFWLSLLAYLWTGVFLHLSYPRYYWFLLAIAAAALHVMRSQRLSEKETAPSTRSAISPTAACV